MSADDVSYLDPETIGGLNLYAYCNNNPVMNIDPEGNAWWHWIIGAVAVIGITAAIVATAGAIAVGLGASAAVTGGVMAGAAVGGIVAGGTELITQGIASDWESIDYKALAIETFTGSAYGAISGAMNMTTSVGLRLGLRAGLVGLSTTNTVLHGINNKESPESIIGNAELSFLTSIAFQSILVANDARIGKLSSSILEMYKLDGNMVLSKTLATIGLASVGKNFWGNRNLWINFVF